MLEEIKDRGDLIAAHRPTEASAYIEGIVQKVHRDGDDYYYEIAWEDGQHFGELFYEGELDEIDLDESEATIRVAMGAFLSEEALDEWFDLPNGKLHGLSPFEALETLGLKRVAAVCIDDYSDALREDDGYEDEESDDSEDEIEDQLGELFGPQGSRS